jgi:hypothetical protein
MGAAVAIVFIFMHFPTRFPDSAPTLLGLGDPAHQCFNGFKVNSPRADGYHPSHSHQVWELGKLMLVPEAWRTVIAMDLIPLSFWANAGRCCGLGSELSTVDDFWKSLPSSFHTWYVDYTVRMIEYIARTSSTDTSLSRTTFVVGTGHDCKEIITSALYKPLATLAGVSNVHARNKGSDGRSQFT